ncbi:response regulator [Sulfurimonas sediminis]|uniref:Sensory/regulatory protein RpfC n=1 Tax=Sulfurimonas sediminis TaxID=2590020 RepID=A0A7M1AYM4_9BACT|nr:FIST N-terminal domain-containing protein [Sulfurimonas sediminis]QOP42465.1 response regulator [Sulfurimonas sediminis]
MKQLNYKYTSKKEFLEYLHVNDVHLFSDTILIQMFTSIEDTEEVETIANDVCAILPNAKLIGASTAGEILECQMLEKHVILSISVFEKTTLDAVYIDEKDSYKLGEKVAKKLLKDDTKCVISFVEGLSHLGEEYLCGFNAHNNKNIIIAGGMAGDLLTFSHTFVIYQNKIYNTGTVAVALHGDALEVTNDYNLGWRAVGPPFIITKAEGNRVYEINNKPIKMLYGEVLGQEVIQNMPASASEFPLLKQENGVLIARSMINVLEDGSIIYAGKLQEGDKVHFGLGSSRVVNHYDPAEKSDLTNKEFQAAFIYSCAGRKQFLSFELEKTFIRISQLAPTAGFFTYGEFYTDAQHQMMLNMTNTLLFLNEKGTKHFKKTPIIHKEFTQPSRLTESATLHLIDYVSKNLQQQQKEFDTTKFKLNEFLEAINSVIIISRTDLQGKITYVNEEFEKISGYKKSELLGKNHNIIRNPLTDAQIFKEMWQTIKKGNVWHGNLANRAKDGSIYYVKSHIFPIFDQEHNITEYMAIREDITDLVTSKKAYENQLKFTNMLLDNEENIVIVTKNNKIDKMNQAFYRTFGYEDLESFVSWHECICDLFIEKEGYLKKEKRPKMWYDPILKEPYKLHLALMLDANHQERIYNVKSREVVYDDETTYVIHTFNDITELEQAKQKAQKAEIAQAMFLANMSHEIRTPMNGILGFAELLQSTELSDTQKKYVDIINSSTQTLLSIINDILDSSKIANNKIELEYIEINPYVEFSTTYELLKSLAEQKSLVYQHHFDIKMFECILSDPTRLRQVITNLLSNAIKFTPQNGEVLFKTEVIKANEQFQTIRFSISDTGIGIPKEKLQTIFKPFSQADDSTTRKFGGTGLGLTISADLVKLFGGKLEVRSQEGKGTTFFFDLEFEKCQNSTTLSKLLTDYELLIIGDTNHLIIQKIDETLASFHLNYKHIEKEEDFLSKLSPNSIILTLDTEKGMQARSILPREQIVCISDTCNNEHLDCVDLTFDESFSSNLYNFLLSKMQNHTSQHQEVKRLLTQTLKILVAEDYDINRMLIESLLEKHENIVYEFAHDGEEAVQKATTSHYDMIFMDVNMPKMNGLDATKMIRKKLSQHIPIIALTANALKGDKERFLAVGMDDYIAKPIKAVELDNIILKYAPSQQQKAFDFAELLQKNKMRLELDEAVIIKLLRAFTQNVETSLTELKEAIKENDTQRILDTAHKIKGSAGTLSLDEISTFMQEIEKNIKNNIEVRYNDIFQTIDDYVTSLKGTLANAK